MYENATEGCRGLRVGCHSYASSEEAKLEVGRTSRGRGRDWCSNTSRASDAPTLVRYRAKHHVKVQTVIIKGARGILVLRHNAVRLWGDDGGS